MFEQGHWRLWDLHAFAARWFFYLTEVIYNGNLKSKVCSQTKILRHQLQLPLSTSIFKAQNTGSQIFHLLLGAKRNNIILQWILALLFLPLFIETLSLAQWRVYIYIFITANLKFTISACCMCFPICVCLLAYSLLSICHSQTRIKMKVPMKRFVSLVSVQYLR